MTLDELKRLVEGRTVMFGLTDDGEVKWQLVSDKTRRELSKCLSKIEQFSDVAVEWGDVDATHKAIVCMVELGNVRPYTFDGRASYKRIQSTTRAMTQDEYRAILRESDGSQIGWEKLPNPELKFEEIDSPQLQLEMGCFKGTDMREFLDNCHVFGNIAKLMDEVMVFCFKHLNYSDKVNGIEREEELEVLVSAVLREALINVFVHRSYESTDMTGYLQSSRTGLKSRIQVRSRRSGMSLRSSLANAGHPSRRIPTSWSFKTRML